MTTMNKPIFYFLFISSSLALTPLKLMADNLVAKDAPRGNYVASVKPLQLIMEALISDKDKLELIIPPASSPHTHRLKPSDIVRMKQANMVVWVGKDLESNLVKPLRNVKHTLELIKELGLKDGGKEDEHEGHDDHDEHEAHDDHDEHEAHDDHDEHEAHDDHDEHEAHDDHDEHEAHDDHDEHEAHDDHDHSFDAHIWLSPKLAGRAAQAISAYMQKANPASTPVYKKNLAKFLSELDKQNILLRRKLSAVSDKSFITMHDAFGYFVNEFDLSYKGYVTPSPETGYSARHLAEINKMIRSGNVVCVFSEPQLSKRSLNKLVAGTGVRQEVIDVLGEDVALSRSGYFDLLHSIADSLIDCLKK